MIRIEFKPASQWLTATCLLLTLACTTNAADRPNILVILTDDQGWGDLSLNGNRNLSTPRIDSLAADGVALDRFYVCPVCSPTRAEFLTGRYHPRSGVYSTSAGGERMNLDEVTIADTFKAAGYATGAFGKWHNGMQYPYHPNGRGFDEFYGFCSGHWGDYFSPPLEHNGKIVQGEGFCIDDFTNKAIEFMKNSMLNEQPFFAYLPYNTPHSPMQVPTPYWDKFKDKTLTDRNREPDKENVEHVRCALAMCENIDWNVGRLLDQLADWKIDDNTIVVYFCDNGPNGVRWNGGMKGRKGSTDEGGVRSPCLIRWPSHVARGKVVTQIGAAIDLLPTLAELADIPLKSTQPLDGISLAPLMTGQSSEWADREIVSHWNNKISVRNQQFRLDNDGKLFHLATDPGQRTDVAKQHAAVAHRLGTVAQAFRNETKGFNADKRPFLIGHADYRYTQMPARDASGSGGIKRSNRYPNCSYFLNWTSTEEQITWNVEVAASAKYRVAMHYACPEADLGSVVELRFGERMITRRITQVFDPPLRGQEHDRVERTESYVKDFGVMELGTIALEAGPGKLTLTATEVPGKQVAEFRLLMFERIDD